MAPLVPADFLHSPIYLWPVIHHMLDGTADMDGSLRLQGGEAGPSYEYGRLEIFLRGFWSNICSLDTFTPDSARVACAALGFGGGASLIFPTPFFDDDVVGFFSSAAHGYADSNVTLESCQPPHTGTRILVPLYTPQPGHNLCMSASKELQIVQQDMTEVSHAPEAAKKAGSWSAAFVLPFTITEFASLAWETTRVVLYNSTEPVADTFFLRFCGMSVMIPGSS